MILFLSPFGVFHCLPRITGRMPNVGDEIVYVIYHIVVGSYDSGFSWHTLHSGWIKCAVKSIWRWDRTLRWMIRQEQSKLHIWVGMLCFLDCHSCKTVKSTIMANNKFCDTIFNNVLFDGCI